MEQCDLDQTPFDPRAYGLQPLDLASACHVYNLNLYDGDQARRNLQKYFHLCIEHRGLQVTTSCFKVWRQNKKTNGSAKLIPTFFSGASAEPSSKVRVFFFDDNLEWEGMETSQGICNLRDVETGSFVEFGLGKNGFERAEAGRHTVIHHSTQCQAVLVKANILDAMEDPNYFLEIVTRFSQPDDKILVYMDVNSTIVVNDTIQGKNVVGTLLSTMWEFLELRPSSSFTLHWDGLPNFQVSGPRTFKQIVKEMSHSHHEIYSAFWSESNCWRFFSEMVSRGDVVWGDRTMDLGQCQLLFQEYLVALESVVTKDGIAVSWFKVYEALQGEHTLVLNSFGVDTRKVVVSTVREEDRVIQVAVNHELWDARDVKQFENQFDTHVVS